MGISSVPTTLSATIKPLKSITCKGHGLNEYRIGPCLEQPRMCTHGQFSIPASAQADQDVRSAIQRVQDGKVNMQASTSRLPGRPVVAGHHYRLEEVPKTGRLPDRHSLVMC